MKNQKLYTKIFIILFILIFSFLEGKEYLNFHEENTKNTEYNKKIIASLDTFSVSNIREVNNLEIIQTPDLRLLDQIVDEIDNAQSRIYLETYILTETRIQDALKRAFYDGVDVQVIVEKNPYKAYGINNKSYNNLLNIGVPIVWSDSKDYSFNHAKFIVIDDSFYISTGNFSYSTFKHNRDYFLKSDDQKLLSKIIEIFMHDYIGEEKQIFDSNIVLSPFSSRTMFETYFLSAEKSIDMYFQYFKDDTLVETLISKARNGIKIRAIIPKTALENNMDVLEKMEKSGIDFFVMNSPKMHSKMIIADNTYGFVGSINFSTYSLDQNRELGLLIINPEIITKMRNFFEEDRKNKTTKK